MEIFADLGFGTCYRVLAASIIWDDRFTNLADLYHILQLCSGTESMRKELFCVTSSWSQFRSLLFQGHPVPDECNGLELRVIYIASVFELAVSALLTGVTPNDVSELIAGAADLAGTGR